VLVDLAGPRHGEVELTRRLAARHPHVQVMVVTAEVDGDRVGRALDAGAVGYLLKDAEPQVLRDGVRAVARGESPLDPRAVRAMLRARPGLRGEDLTAREREVLSLVACGLANKQIARRLCITDGTVKAHVGSIFARIGVTDRTSAAVWAERNLAVAALPALVSVRDEWGPRDEWADRPERTARDVATRGRAWPSARVGRLQAATG
jgi:DNA-binding NarL/FixJ family response regulator